VDKLEFLPPDDVLIFRYLSLSLSCFCFFGLFMCNPFVSFAFGAQFSVVVVVIVYCWWQFAMQFFNTRETVLLLPLLLLRWPCDCGYSVVVVVLLVACCIFCNFFFHNLHFTFFCSSFDDFDFVGKHIHTHTNTNTL